MAEWIISRPVTGFGSPQQVTADKVSVGADVTSLYKDGAVVCVVYPAPGLTIIREDLIKS